MVTVTQSLTPRPSSSSTPSDVTSRASREGSLCFSAQSSASALSCRVSGSPPPTQDRGPPSVPQASVALTPAPRRGSTAPSSVASASSTSSAAPPTLALDKPPPREWQGTGRIPPPTLLLAEAPTVPKRLPSKSAKDTTLSPLDERFQPPVAGSVHYRDANGILHVIAAPGVELPASYDRSGVIVETVEEAVAIPAALADPESTC